MNTTTKHSPGPWTCFKRSGGFSIESPGLHAVASINWIMAKRDCAEANARLIAAAPDLLEALRAAADYMGEMGHPVELLEQARAAIAKAEGA